MLRRVFGSIVVILVATSPVLAASPLLARQIESPVCAPAEGDARQVVTRPFLKVLAFSVAGVAIVPAVAAEAGTLLCRDRELLRIEMAGVPTDQAQAPYLAAVTSGRVTPAAWQTLTEAVAAARIGQVKSCRPVTLGGAVWAEITWFAKLRRTNTFILSSSDFSLPACSPAVEDLWRALQQPELGPDSKSIVILASALP